MKKNLKLLLLMLICMPTFVFAKGSVKVNKEEITLKKGESGTFIIEADNVTGRIDISSLNNEVLKINDSGMLFDKVKDNASLLYVDSKIISNYEITIDAISAGNTKIKIDLYDVASYDDEEITGSYEIDVTVVEVNDKLEQFKNNMDDAFEKLNKELDSEEKINYTITDDYIEIDTVEGKVKINYTLTEDNKVIFTTDTKYTSNMSYDDFLDKNDNIAILIGHILISISKGADPESAYSYSLISVFLNSLKNQDSNYLIIADNNTTVNSDNEIITESEFKNDSLKYIKRILENQKSLKDNLENQINSYELENKIISETSDEIVVRNTLTVDLNADYTKINDLSLIDEDFDWDFGDWHIDDIRKANDYKDEKTDNPKTGLPLSIITVFVILSGLVIYYKKVNKKKIISKI